MTSDNLPSVALVRRGDPKSRETANGGAEAGDAMVEGIEMYGYAYAIGYGAKATA